eukprot:TRINITY_DN14823_c0_g1_i1.p1 TRINITY_DN14823_c0_g1~~TRINITY_DN14823_c0_g1_i1.p1  ORF type:complete len:206 (+),score=40.71 TRINITY_DN14823_c0_g1_i1:133-750(+)
MGLFSSTMNANQMSELQFNLKFASKQMLKMSKKQENEEAVSRKKAKDALVKQNADGARIHAQNAIRNKKEALNYLRLSSRLDSVSSSIKHAADMQLLGKQMGNITIGMDKALKSMNIAELTSTMDKFEAQFENLDVVAGYTETAISSTTALTMPESEVNSLLTQIADEHNLDVQQQLNTGLGNVSALKNDQLDLSSNLELATKKT